MSQVLKIYNTLLAGKEIELTFLTRQAALDFRAAVSVIHHRQYKQLIENGLADPHEARPQVCSSVHTDAETGRTSMKLQLATNKSSRDYGIVDFKILD